MSDRREAHEKPLIILQNAEDYLPGSLIPSVGFNNKAVIGPSQEGHSQTWTLYKQLLLKIVLRRQT